MMLRRWHDPATLADKVELSDAKPQEQMTGELMVQIERGSPWAELSGEPLTVLGNAATPRLRGSVLTIWDDFGHRYIYRVVGYDWSADVYDLEWPD